MIEITNGKKTISVPDATAVATLKEKWLKGWTIVKRAGDVPNEVIQFQEAKLKEAEEKDLSLTPVRELEGTVDTLTSEQLLKLLQDPRKSVKALAKKQLTKLRSDSGKQEDR
jgi:hypothetical protein